MGFFKAFPYFCQGSINDKWNAFGFHIVNFPIMSSDIPSAPTWGVYVCQLIRYSRCSSNKMIDFLSHRKAWLRDYCYTAKCLLMLSVKKFYIFADLPWLN